MGHTLDLKYGNQKGHRVEKQTSALISDQTVTDQWKQMGSNKASEGA